MLRLSPKRPGRWLIGGTPEGHDARILAQLARSAENAGVIHIALDDVRQARLAEALAFFAPDVELLELPAWDCLPYDRVSPNPTLISRRIDALTRLLEPPLGPRLLLTTVNAALQQVPPRGVFAESTLAVRVGQRLRPEKLQNFLTHNGYLRTETVREPGEFAVRGGILDLFPPGADEPVRLDFFGDEVEGLRTFDPMSQRTRDRRDSLLLKPMSEVFLDDAAIARFRAGYRELFGAVTDADPLYEAVSAGRKHAGMEHWLPLFHPHLEPLFAYLPHAAISLDPQADEARVARLNQITDFYQSRLTLQVADRKARNPVYKPVPPERLFLDPAAWDRWLSHRAVAELSPFAALDTHDHALDGGGRRGRDFADIRARPDANVFDAVREQIAGHHQAGRRVLVAGYSAGSRDRLLAVLADHGIEGLEPAESWSDVGRFSPAITALVVLGMEHGFESADLAVITEQDILGDRLIRPPRRKRRAANFIAEAAGLTPGDLVVHLDHGIGRYDGLETLDVSGAPHDCLRLIYDGGDKLYVPVENIEVLSRYGSEAVDVPLDRLGGAGWQSRKARVRRRLKDMADALLRIAAARELRRAESLPAPQGLYEEFAARFPYPETEDQDRAISDVLEDLASGKPMDRLVCGDVGFGKTEVALRAAFVAAMAGLQVAVVVPTTLLARQHHRTFSARFQNLPVRIEPLSRLVTPRDSKRTRDGLAEGTVDIVVGTHALLAKTIRFKRLGLVIVDEEQHFGVKQKERLKELRADVHVLTLTATPIPRTLQMALSGVREMSLITTPPIDRLAVRTFVLPYDPMVIREAILREHYRGGQSFYVCPHIEDLDKVSNELRELAPEVKVVMAHGQMAASTLEEVMGAFDDGQFDVLLSTNIIESGLDIPRANTLIIHRADRFGLAQLYQLRGRVGRSKQRGYAYFTYAPRQVLSGTAQQRLHVIETLDSLGAGFQLASHDMDIRGAGNLLGEEQSGQVREVGIELYQQMLEEAVEAARTASVNGASADPDPREHWSPQIHLGMPVLIPDTYVADLNVRLGLYRRLADLADAADTDAFAAELIDRFGALPPEVENLLKVMLLKRLCRTANVERLEAGPKGIVLTFRNNHFAHPERLVPYLARQSGAAKLRPDHKLVYARAWDSPEKRLAGVHRLMKELAALAV